MADGRVRVLIEKLIKTLEPSARLLTFGSSCNSFGLRNSGTLSFQCLTRQAGTDGRYGSGGIDR